MIEDNKKYFPKSRKHLFKEISSIITKSGFFGDNKEMNKKIDICLRRHLQYVKEETRKSIFEKYNIIDGNIQCNHCGKIIEFNKQLNREKWENIN